jgi:hypothetical protein
MDKNLQDMEKTFEEIDLDFLDDDLSEDDNEEIKEAMKQLLEEIDNDNSDS